MNLKRFILVTVIVLLTFAILLVLFPPHSSSKADYNRPTVVSRIQMMEITFPTEEELMIAADLPDYLPEDSWYYKNAAGKYGIYWEVLSAVHWKESGKDRDTFNAISGAGAKGCMQFMPGTFYGRLRNPYGYITVLNEWPSEELQQYWLENKYHWFKGYGVDGDGNGIPEIDSCKDTLYSAANYLGQNYKSGGLYSAIWQYNHSDAYVRSVLSEAYRLGLKL